MTFEELSKLSRPQLLEMWGQTIDLRHELHQQMAFGEGSKQIAEQERNLGAKEARLVAILNSDESLGEMAAAVVRINVLGMKDGE